MAKVINDVTPEGLAFGYHLARFVDVEEAKGKLASGKERCHNCAFRQGTYPNGSPSTLMDAQKCVMEGIPFLCHEDMGPCAGWALLRRHKPQSKIEMPWKFSDEYESEVSA